MYCDAPPIAVGNVKDIAGFAGRNDSHPRRFDEGNIWRSLGLPRSGSVPPTRFEESKTPDTEASLEANRRRSRFLGSLAVLASLGFGGLVSAASSTAKNIAKLPATTSISLNLGSSKASPYLAAYYNPYSLLPYPLFYPGFGLLPMMDPTKPQTQPQNDLTPQVISVFDSRESIDYSDNNEEYADDEKKSGDGADPNAQKKVRLFFFYPVKYYKRDIWISRSRDERVGTSERKAAPTAFIGTAHLAAVTDTVLFFFFQLKNRTPIDRIPCSVRPNDEETSFSSLCHLRDTWTRAWNRAEAFKRK